MPRTGRAVYLRCQIPGRVEQMDKGDVIGRRGTGGSPVHGQTDGLASAHNLRQWFTPFQHQCIPQVITQWDSGDRQSAKKLARSVLDRSQFGLPVSANDFFCDGFANWLLGNRERANYDFERSGLSSENHYRHLIQE